MILLRRRSFEAALATGLFFLGFRIDLTRDLDGDLSGEDEMKDTRSITFALNRIVAVCVSVGQRLRTTSKLTLL